MSPESRYSDYDAFAWMYNKHWGNEFTPAALAVIGKLVLPVVPHNARILDLCCGTGQLAQALSERGYTVTGLDGSMEMLKYARENAPGVEFILEDARTFILPETFDAVVSVFDSLNHVMTIDELMAVFRNVYDSLKAGGLFLFDMNLEPGYISNWHGVNAIIKDDHICVFPNKYDQENGIGEVDFTIFRLDEYWRRSDFKLLQKCYPETELRSALDNSGFTVVKALAMDRINGLTALTPESVRVVYLCRK